MQKKLPGETAKDRRCQFVLQGGQTRGAILSELDAGSEIGPQNMPVPGRLPAGKTG